MKKNKLYEVFRHINMGQRDECWPWTSATNKDGRPYFTFEGKKLLAYRLTYELVTGNSLQDKLARHTCDNEICCNPYHIIEGDHQENMDDMKERQRHGLPHVTVQAIRKLENVSNALTVATNFGISETTVRDIWSRKNYSHVKD